MIESVGKKNILILEANPRGTMPLDGMAEIRAIRELLIFRRMEGQFDLKIYTGITRQNFLTAIAEYKPAIIHFIGHGSENGLCIEDMRGSVELISHNDVVDILKIYSDVIECAFFNTDKTNSLAQAVAEFIPAVVGICSSINTQTAILYATHFYQGFFDTLSFEKAHQLGKISIGHNKATAYQFYFTPREQLDRLRSLKTTWPDYQQLRDTLTSVLPSRNELRLLCLQCFPLGQMREFPRTDNTLEILDWVASRELPGYHPPLLYLLKLLYVRSCKQESQAFITAWLDEICTEIGVSLDDLILPSQPYSTAYQQDNLINRITTSNGHGLKGCIPKSSSQREPIDTPYRILLLAANSFNASPLRLQTEFRDIIEGLKLAGSNCFQIESCLSTRPKDLRRVMLDFKPHVAHFSGHASDKGICLEDDNGQAKLIGNKALANLFALFTEQILCVVLNACYSSSQATEIAKHIPYVIGMKDSVTDKAARTFSLGFYDALFRGRSIKDAFHMGCNALELEGIPEHELPILLQNLQQ